MSEKKENGPKISIVTLSFNQKAYLQEAMDSVLGQNYPSIEYIVIDPGSNDGSRELIQQYRDRLAHAILEKDRGAADGLNKGFSLATGDVFGFLNADDIFLPGALQQVADFFRRRPDCDIAFGNGYVLDGAGRRTRFIKARGFTVQRYLHSGAHWLQQSTFFRREAFVRSPGFNLDNRTCWDGELFVNMVNQGARVGYIDADLAGFRIHGSSISGTGTNFARYQEDRRRIFRQQRGRDWRTSDSMWAAIYRIEGLARKGAWLLSRSGKKDAK